MSLLNLLSVPSDIKYVHLFIPVHTCFRVPFQEAISRSRCTILRHTKWKTVVLTFETIICVVMYVNSMLYNDTVYCVLCNVYCVLCTVYCVLCTVYCVLCTVYCVLCTVYCVLCTVYCVLCTVYCVLCTVYCVLCNVV